MGVTGMTVGAVAVAVARVHLRTPDHVRSTARMRGCRCSIKRRRKARHKDDCEQSCTWGSHQVVALEEHRRGGRGRRQASPV